MPTAGRIKVLHTIRQGKIGGGETHVLDLVSNLSDDFESEVLAFTDGEMVRELKSRGILCHVIYTEKPFDFRVWSQVRNLMISRNIDVVHAHGTRACSNSFWAANKENLPLLYTIHGWSFHQDQSPVVRNVREFSERFLVRRTNLNISVSQSNNNDGIQRIGMPNSTVVNYGVNTEKFDPYTAPRLTRGDLSLPDDKVIVGMLARLTIQKDPVTFVKAAGKVLEKTDKVHFLLVGGGELEDDCRREVSNLGIGEHITFQAFRTDVPEVLKLMDIYCLPSLWEGLPIGILEAMAMEKAIVATPVDGTKEVIRHEISGMLFPEYQYAQMAECILKLAGDGELRQKLGNEARRIIDESFGVDRMALEIGDLYKNLLTERKQLFAS